MVLYSKKGVLKRARSSLVVNELFYKPEVTDPRPDLLNPSGRTRIILSIQKVNVS
jgi:hypothetical protein